MTKSITKVCPICNSTFVPTCNRQKYCGSAECMAIVHNEHAKKYNAKKDKKLTKGKRLIPEMLKLREKNYTNAEIARLVGLHVTNVFKHIGKQPEHITMATRIVAAQKRKLNAMRRGIIAGNLANNIPCKTVAFVTMEAPSKTKKNNAGIAGNTAIVPALNKAI